MPTSYLGIYLGNSNLNELGLGMMFSALSMTPSVLRLFLYCLLWHKFGESVHIPNMLMHSVRDLNVTLSSVPLVDQKSFKGRYVDGWSLSLSAPKLYRAEKFEAILMCVSGCLLLLHPSCIA